MFSVSDCLLINKTDTCAVFDFDFDACAQRARKLNPDITVIPLSALTGDGFDAWISWLKQQAEDWRNSL